MSVLVPTATRRAPRGMVCAVDHLAAEAGVAILRDGGSAADAAVAASAVLAVTTQHMCGLGGDVLAVVQAPGAPPSALLAAGRAGSGADPEGLRREGHGLMPFRGDIRSVPVPGCVDGWVALHAAHGRLPLARVLEPAHTYARDGFPASPTLAAAAALVADLPGADDYRQPLRPGTTVRRPGVARVLEAVGGEGRDGFYLGEFGRGLLALGPGEFTEQDLARPAAEWAEPLRAAAWGWDLWATPPPTQAYLTLAASWIADGLDLPADPDDPRWPHLLIEAARQAGRDRVDMLHDGADGAALLASDRLAAGRAAVRPDAAAVLADRWAGGGTIGLTAVDEDRMGVSLLQSNATGFGAHIVEPSTGVFLHNRGVGFSLVPGHPAEYGPRRRPPHTLSPCLATSPDGGLAAVLASMGGDSQPLILLQLLARHRRAAQGLAEAVAAGRWTLAGPYPDRGPAGFSTWTASGQVEVRIEGHAPAGWDAGLTALGHRVGRTAAFDSGYGHAHFIAVGDGHLAGATDPRALTGAAAGY